MKTLRQKRQIHTTALSLNYYWVSLQLGSPQQTNYHERIFQIQ